MSVRIALIQQAATPDKAANLKRGIENVRRAAEGGAKIVCFAELAFEPFYPQRPNTGDLDAISEPIPGPTTRAFMDLARELKIVIIINLFESSDGHHYDSSPVMNADGQLLGVTRMVHITDYPLFHEKGYYTPGAEKPMVYDTK